MSLLRPGRQAFALFIVALFLSVAALSIADAQDQAAAAAPPRQIYIAPQEDNSKCTGGAGPCWDITVIPVNPGENVQFVVDLSHTTQPHDFHVKDASGVEVGKVPPSSTIGGVYYLNLTIPQSIPGGGYDFFCSVHPKTMVGKIKLVSALGTSEAPAVPELGVHFLSYWVGMIAFMLLFLVYGLTFFLFKYNETPATTDHWDRTGGEGLTEKPGMRGGRASLLALLLAIVIIVAVVGAARYLASR